MQSISERFSNQILERWPDLMLDYVSGFVIMAYRNLFLYFDVSERQDSNEETVTIGEDDVQTIEVKENMCVITLSAITTEEKCIVVEDL